MMARNLHPSKQATPYSTQKSAFGWGFYLLLTCLISTAVGLSLSVSENLLLWFPGQLILAVALLQWFILLHESGHYTLFPEKIWNHVTGHLASLFSAIPFYSWSQVHHLHHVWTGWQDLDPTTETLVPKNLSAWKRSFINVCWKFHIPVFAIIYRFQNFWNLRRLEKFMGSSKRLKKMRWNSLALLLIYGLLGYQLEPEKILQLVGLALPLTLLLQETILLSQHTHIPMQLSHGKEVAPFSHSQQVQFTRSLLFPKWVSQWILFSFDQHELHHKYVHVPGYRLQQVADRQTQSMKWYPWVKEVRKIPGEIFLFKNRQQSQINL